MKQTTFASAAWDRKGKVTRRERFLAEMDAVIPWERLLKLIEPHYPKAGNGTQPMPMERMLRIYFMQNWFNLSGPAAEDSLYDSESMRRFAGIELAEDTIPDETTILRFRHLLERHQLTERMFAEICSLLEEKRLLLKSGTIVDATIIEAPPSTKNEQKARDPEMRQGKKGGGWHFGMKAHIGTDVYGRVHSLATTHAGAADITQLPKLLHGDERALYGDQAYWSADHREAAEQRGIRYRVNRRPNGRVPLSPYQRLINRSRSRTRARGEHAFHVVKCLWGFTRVRYRGLAKNTARLCVGIFGGLAYFEILMKSPETRFHVPTRGRGVWFFKEPIWRLKDWARKASHRPLHFSLSRVGLRCPRTRYGASVRPGTSLTAFFIWRRTKPAG